MDEFEALKEKYGLDEICNEECPMCGGTMTFYDSRYVEGVEIRFCSECHELETGISIKAPQDNLCPYCNQLIKYDEEEYVECQVEGCNAKIHKSCAENLICDKCKIWVCEKHESEYYICDRCGMIHDYNCIVSFDNDFQSIFGTVCEDCFHRDDDIITEIKRPFDKKIDETIIRNIDNERDFYVKEAKENFDLTIMLTHLLKGKNDDEIFKTMMKILENGRLIASQTGYFGHTDGTRSVCFADLTIRGLNRHSQKYSRFGFSFLKAHLFSLGCGPALYIREDILKSGFSVSDNIKPFINKIDLEKYDFHHEREWRLPKDLEFKITDLFVVYAPTKYHNDIKSKFPQIKLLLDLDFMQLI